MSLYTTGDEGRIRAQALVREWTKSGLLDAAQGAGLEAELRVNVRRTNLYLRGGLALFTAFIIAASALLPVVALRLDRVPGAVVIAIAAIVSLWLAQYLVVSQRFYRFGVEEALAVGSVALMAGSVGALTSTRGVLEPGNVPLIAGLATLAAGGFGIYWRFGYVYAMVGGVASAAAIPFQLDARSSVQHALAAAILAAVFGAARRQRARSAEEYRAEDYALLQAAAWGGLYLSLNLQLGYSRIEGAFYWFTYAAVWGLPGLGLYLSIRDKDRWLLDVSLLMLLATLLTNKAYLGWPRHEWDPMVLGFLMIGTAIAMRRWLAGGVNGQRGGFTPRRILSRDTGAVTVLGTVSARFQPGGPSYPASRGGGFDGGRSGGGGASESF